MAMRRCLLSSWTLSIPNISQFAAMGSSFTSLKQGLFLFQAQPGNVLIQKAWLAGVTPIVMDCETSVQEKALDCLDQLLLQPIKHYQNFSLQDRSQALAWDLLMLFTNESQELG